MNEAFTVPVTAVQRFCMHDGDGIRTTVFLKGCPLRCKWCHNPECKTSVPTVIYNEKNCIFCHSCTVCSEGCHAFENGMHTFDRELCKGCFACCNVCPSDALKRDYIEMTADEIVNASLRDLPFYSNGGGVTLSGGEPMYHGEKTVELLWRLKNAGLNTALETCGVFDAGYLESLSGSVDTLLWDVKDSDPVRLYENTGGRLDEILSNLKCADSLGIPTVLRCIILEGINFTKEHLDFLSDLKNSLRSCRKTELIAYHPMGESKCRACGGSSSFHGKEYIPDREKLNRARLYLEGRCDFE